MFEEAAANRPGIWVKDPMATKLLLRQANGIPYNNKTYIQSPCMHSSSETENMQIILTVAKEKAFCGNHLLYVSKVS